MRSVKRRANCHPSSDGVRATAGHGLAFFLDRLFLRQSCRQATHAGKSLLVSELLRRGATYFSDEYALIDAEGWVHPYPRPLLLRDGQDSFPVLPTEWNQATAHTAAPVGWILSLVYQPASIRRLTAVPKSHALLTLLRNTPQVLAESTDIMAAFQRPNCQSGFD